MTEDGPSSRTASFKIEADRRANSGPVPRRVTEYDVAPLGESYRRHRWIRPSDIEWAERADRILMEHGAIRSVVAYGSWREARGRGLRLIALWSDLGLRPRSQLREDVVQVEGGFVWTIEYVGPGSSADTAGLPTDERRNPLCT
jgi:hypothetical protein